MGQGDEGHGAAGEQTLGRMIIQGFYEHIGASIAGAVILLAGTLVLGGSTQGWFDKLPIVGQSDATYQAAIDTISAQLADPKRTVRVNGVIKAEQFLHDHPEAQQRLIPVLAEMIREYAKAPIVGGPPFAPNPDIARALQIVAHQHGTATHKPDEMIKPADYVAPDLSGAYLARAKLDGAYLADANLDDADLTNANIQNVVMWWASMHATRLTGATLSGVDLTAAKGAAEDAQHGTRFDHANLDAVTLDQADFAYANFNDAGILETGPNDHPTGPVGLKHATFHQAIFIFSSIESPDLRNADFTGAKFIGTTFIHAVADHATFNKAKLMGSSVLFKDPLTKVNMTGSIHTDSMSP